MDHADRHEPKYARLIRQLQERLSEMHERSESCFPSERELCEQYGVSRITVRRALAELEASGSIYRIHGKGAFVSREKFQQRLTRLTSFTEDMRDRNMVSGAKILAFETVSATARIAEGLQVEEGAPVALLKRLRLANGAPMAIETCYLTCEVGAVVKEHIADDVSLYALLRGVCGIIPVSAEQSIEVGLLQPWERSLLGKEAPVYALCMTRQTFDETHRVVEYVESKYRGDGYSYHISIKTD